MYILFIEITLWLCNVSNTAKPIIHSNDITLFEVVKSTACYYAMCGAFGEYQVKFVYCKSVGRHSSLGGTEA